MKEDKGLDGILKLDKIRHLSGDEIGSIWIQHYAQKDAVSAVVPEKSFQTIRTAATLYPLVSCWFKVLSQRFYFLICLMLLLNFKTAVEK